MFPVSTVMCQHELCFQAKTNSGLNTLRFSLSYQTTSDQITLHCLNICVVFSTLPNTEVV